jgi:hypothetical protein
VLSGNIMLSDNRMLSVDKIILKLYTVLSYNIFLSSDYIILSDNV